MPAPGCSPHRAVRWGARRGRRLPMLRSRQPPSRALAGLPRRAVLWPWARRGWRSCGGPGRVTAACARDIKTAATTQVWRVAWPSAASRWPGRRGLARSRVPPEVQLTRGTPSRPNGRDPERHNASSGCRALPLAGNLGLVLLRDAHCEHRSSPRFTATGAGPAALRLDFAEFPRGGGVAVARVASLLCGGPASVYTALDLATTRHPSVDRPAEEALSALSAVATAWRAPGGLRATFFLPSAPPRGCRRGRRPARGAFATSVCPPRPCPASGAPGRRQLAGAGLVQQGRVHLRGLR